VALPNPWVVPLVTVSTAARLLGISTRHAYRCTASGDLPTVRLSVQMVRTVDLYRLVGLPIPERPTAPPRVVGGVNRPTRR
jgi:hypothetical protein